MAQANNNSSTASNMTQPTNADIFNLLQTCATKNDMNLFTEQVNKFATETNNKFQAMEERIENVATTSTDHNDRIEWLEAAVEGLKQDQLKNNLCISGVPADLIKDNNTADAVIAIAKTLGIEIARQHFSSYAVANDKLIIVRVYNIKHKQSMMNKIRVKKSLMVEEVFKKTKSNSQIYLNDHLTPYFSNLYLMARNAKKEGKLASATSYGGKIRARKSSDEPPIIITTHKQLQAMIDYEYDSDGDTDTDSVQLIGSDMETSQTTNQSNEDNPNNSNTGSNSTKRTTRSKHTEQRSNNTNDKAKKDKKEKKDRAEKPYARKSLKRKYDSTGARSAKTKKTKERIDQHS